MRGKPCRFPTPQIESVAKRNNDGRFVFRHSLHAGGGRGRVEATIEKAWLRRSQAEEEEEWNVDMGN